jgi:hypothetical protein
MRLNLQSAICNLQFHALALPLLVLLVAANHAHDAAAPDDLALVANAFH